MLHFFKSIPVLLGIVCLLILLIILSYFLLPKFTVTSPFGQISPSFPSSVPLENTKPSPQPTSLPDMIPVQPPPPPPLP